MDSNDQTNESAAPQQQEEDTTASGIEIITTDDLGADAANTNEDGEEPAEIELDALKEAAIYALLAIRKQGEPKYQLQVVRDAIRDAIRTDRMGRDEDFAKYLNNTLGMKIMPIMSRERSLDNDVSAAFCLRYTSLYILKALFVID